MMLAKCSAKHMVIAGIRKIFGGFSKVMLKLPAICRECL